MPQELLVDCSTGDEHWVDIPGPSLDDLKDAKLRLVKAKRDGILEGGWSHDFGATGTHTLDLRNADDKANWTLLLIKTQAMIAGGGGAFPVEIRTADNLSISIPASEANAAMQSFLAWGEGVLKRKWDLDTQVAAADTEEALAAIDVEAGW